MFSLKKFFVVSFFWLLVFVPPVFAEALYDIAPTLLPHTTRQMKSPGFWISRHPSPDKIVLTQEEIAALNRSVQEELKLTRDILASSEYDGKNLKEGLNLLLTKFQKGEFYFLDEDKNKKEFFQQVKVNMGFDDIPAQIHPPYGFIVHFADERILPTDDALYEKQGDIDFDELQNSDLDVGTPVVILHESKDRQWYYVLTDISGGWVRKENVALAAVDDVKDFFAHSELGVVVKAKADIFWDAEMTQYYDYARMGAEFVREKASDDAVQVRLPLRNEDGLLVWHSGFMKRESLSQGYFVFTARRAIEQAFELLNEPYGWGGMHGEQDCSRFLQQVFAAFGIHLPRNSKEQAQVGRAVARFTEKSSEKQRFDALAKEGVGGTTILPLKGHIMLYLGNVDDRAYAIHAVWGYRENIGLEDRVRVINRVAVTDLSLGEGSKKGSLLQRILSINRIDKEK
ncbi:MAG: hypothetical protein A2Z88_00800 [Omnitrophica WOR_2 bacterium GWA2_47_8]|nr:MAG: hypothetical protein A2Z88_00800 [Omnitrophica WOR_2 bacterium GWA2_47_8]